MIHRLVRWVQSLLSGGPRLRKTPRRIPQLEHKIDRALVSRSAIRTCEVLQAAGHRAYVVGGAVRDLLLGIAPKDFDVATDATPEQVARACERQRREFDIGVMVGRLELLYEELFRATRRGRAEACLPCTIPGC